MPSNFCIVTEKKKYLKSVIFCIKNVFLMLLDYQIQSKINMKYKNVTKELVVKDVVIYGESKYNSAYVNYHLVLKICLSCACLERQIITAEREHTFPSCCNNWYKNESRNFMTFFYINLRGRILLLIYTLIIFKV